MNLAYVAGLFDGEGCVNFSRARKSIYPRVLVVNTNMEILEALQTKFGGDIKPLSKRQVGWKQGYCWRLSWSRAVDFLDQISKYLRIKQMQASVVFAWDATRGSRGKLQDPEVTDLLVAQLHWLNKRGPNTEPDPIEVYLQTEKSKKK